MLSTKEQAIMAAMRDSRPDPHYHPSEYIAWNDTLMRIADALFIRPDYGAPLRPMMHAWIAFTDGARYGERVYQDV